MDLEHMSWPEAVETAKVISGKTNKQIAQELTIKLGRETPFLESTVQRWFNPYDDYWPSSSLNPILCEVLGNGVLIEWQSAQIKKYTSLSLTASPETLLGFMPNFVCSFGMIGKSIAVAVEDGAISPKEARDILSDAAVLIKGIDSLKDMLGPLAEKSKRV